MTKGSICTFYLVRGWEMLGGRKRNISDDFSELIILLQFSCFKHSTLFRVTWLVTISLRHWVCIVTMVWSL